MSKNHVLLVDFNDQYHAIRRLWGNRSLNVRALLKLFPDVTVRVGVAKAPSRELVTKFDQMLQHNGFRCEYLIGAPNWQTCTALLIDQLVTEWTNNPHGQVTVVSGSPDMVQVKKIADHLGCPLRVCGFGPASQSGLPLTVLTPVPLCQDLGVRDALTLERI